ncbi:FKBP-type peptidyl-prolyl cis-trans isomerase [Klebsiella pneumoniae]|uniref:FKBP-type peptidyl-prolyl cis-trans isomerase n=1 Tax=Klebsiella pneumoniae TaxID=573 RepID=UPI00195A78FB|nr:FKBP-type peptidyl-prolyl cis-trans isomerase [Klebsiella pneumoniae]MBM9412522.1 FKBP-type peptidyl-prolyl cis-trans isomerase [Klebsiella pneumoniae]MED6003281.1 FKBP-type peptidyl-prolyl cis-trans isomerase [Klebsiella pneumoniae]MED6056164.1 FKBP-type peptidyl-prolyl cis-trans isomerase [Klebsiella pneumoniae]HBW3470922.1 peptidylprolyl isomerase [Klebsiella pneumoniae]
MNRAATLTLNAPLLMLVAALALSTPFTAGAAPAFLDYAQQQTQQSQAQEKNDAASAKQTQESRQSADNKKTGTNTSQLQKRITSQQAAIAQKDKLIQQLKKQLAATPQTDTAGANEQAALNKRINELQVALSAATAEKEALIKKAGVVQNNNLQQSQAAARQQIQQLTTQIQQAEAENKRLSASFTTLNKDKHALMTQLAATEKEKQAVLEQVKALNADKQSPSTRLAAADKAPHGPANDAAAPKNEPPEMAAIVAAYRLQADKDNAQLRMKEDEIELLRTQLSVQSKTRSGESAAAKLSASGEQQAYAIGASMGSEALNVLTTRRTQGVTVDAGLVLQGIEDAFRGQLRLGEQERNKALFDVSQQVFQNLNKIEQKNISAGKKYQQAFARKKDVVFKEGVYSRVDYLGKGKISGNDLVTVVIKEMLTDGTVINDMEAKDQALTQKLDAYPPVFREPLKRLQNHGSVTLVVPPEKAYGSKGLPPKIPPGATMVYSVRIVDSQPEPAK